MSDVTPTPTEPDAPAGGAWRPGAVRSPVEGFYVERQPDQGRYCLVIAHNGTETEVTIGKLGGIDDDIQEAATPGYKAAKAKEYLDALRDARG